MIKSFASKDTVTIWNGSVAKKLPRDMQDRTLRKLRQIDAAQTIEDLRNPPGNQLELLIGERKEEYSIRINRQWRIVFKWDGHDAFDVEIVDYH